MYPRVQKRLLWIKEGERHPPVRPQKESSEKLARKVGNRCPVRRPFKEEPRIREPTRPRLQLLQRREHVSELTDSTLLRYPVAGGQERTYLQKKEPPPPRSVLHQPHRPAPAHDLQCLLLLERKP